MRILSTFVLFLALAWSAGAQAKDYLVTAGGRLRMKPPYEGADSQRLVPVGLLILQPADKPYHYSPPDAGSVFDVVSNRYFQAGPVLNLRGHRSSGGSFAGLKGVTTAVEPGVFVGVRPTPWLSAWVQVRRGVYGHAGWIEDAGLDFVYTGYHWDFSIGPRIGFGDAKYMRTYFGVSPGEAQASPVIDRAYEPGAGQRYTGASASAAYHLDRHWTTLADVTYTRLAGRAQQSPIVQALGARNQVSAGVGLTYTFGPVRF